MLGTGTVVLGPVLIRCSSGVRLVLEQALVGSLDAVACIQWWYVSLCLLTTGTILLTLSDTTFWSYLPSPPRMRTPEKGHVLLLPQRAARQPSVLHFGLAAPSSFPHSLSQCLSLS